jgi:hypothetical protein
MKERSIMTPSQTQAFNAYWSLIRRFEFDIQENGHRPCTPEAAEYWDFDLEEAYEVIHPLLVCISRPQFFIAVSPLPQYRGPFEADNAHKAMMFQLNPPESMYGDPSLLNSENYLCTRNRAEAELTQLAALKEIPVAVPIAPRVGTKIWSDDYVVRWKVPSQLTATPVAPDETGGILEPLSYRLSPGMVELVEAMNEVPQTGKELAVKVGLDYQTVREYLPKLIKKRLVRKVRQGYVRQ